MVFAKAEGPYAWISILWFSSGFHRLLFYLKLCLLIWYFTLNLRFCFAYFVMLSVDHNRAWICRFREPNYIISLSYKQLEVDGKYGSLNHFGEKVSWRLGHDLGKMGPCHVVGANMKHFYKNILHSYRRPYLTESLVIPVQSISNFLCHLMAFV